MDEVQVEGSGYSMPPREGFTVANFLTVTNLERSTEFYATVFDGKVVSKGDEGGAPPYIKIANSWLILNVGGGPTPDKPTVTLRTPPDPNEISSFMNIRVADIQACYETLAQSRSNVHHRALGQIRRDSMLYPRSRRLHYRGRAKQARVVRGGETEGL